MVQDCSYNELYPLQVLDDSMEPEFPAQCVIVLEPSNICATGSFVVVTVGNERWFRQFIRDPEGGEKLVALHPDYSDIELQEGNYKIEGVVVQRNINRKIKHYRPYEPNNGESSE